MNPKIQMVDLRSQYLKIKEEIDGAIRNVLSHGKFINGPEVGEFATDLAGFLGVKHVIPCGNGTDALMISLIALGLKEGNEVVVPAFSYMAPAEVIAFRGLTPVLVDVDERTFNFSSENLEKSITAKTKVIMPVHLFGQCCDMTPIIQLAKKYELDIVEDNAQSLGAEFIHPDGSRQYAGTLGKINCTSFFPAKNLGCYGDGGALFTDDDELAQKIRMIANHGQSSKYRHEMIGCNSRLDTLQAAILKVKLKYLKEYNAARQEVAGKYSEAFEKIPGLEIPVEKEFSTHVYNQYTIKVKERRNELKSYLENKGIPTSIYYPLTLQKQPALKGLTRTASTLDISNRLCEEVLSLPVHTEMAPGEQRYIIEAVLDFFK